MTKTTDRTVKILEQIRDEIRGTRQSLSARIDTTNERLDGTNRRVDGLAQQIERVEKRQIESEVRLSTELTAVVGAVNGVRDLLRERLDQRDRLDDHERRLRVLERGPAGH